MYVPGISIVKGCVAAFATHPKLALEQSRLHFMLDASEARDIAEKILCGILNDWAADMQDSSKNKLVGYAS